MISEVIVMKRDEVVRQRSIRQLTEQREKSGEDIEMVTDVTLL